MLAMEGTSYFADSVLTANRCAQLARQNRTSTERARGTVFSDPPATEDASAVDEIELPRVIPPLPPPRTAVANAAGDRQAAPTHASREYDPGEYQLIQDYGPARIHGGDKIAAGAAWWAASGRCEDPPTALDRYITDEHGLRRRVVYDPTEMARLLQPHRRQTAGACWRLARLLETALDPARLGCESLLILKAVTDAYLVTSRGVDAAADIDVDNGEDFLRTLVQAWENAVGNRDRHADQRHSSVDLHVTASWFQAWAASYDVHDVLPGDWTWVLDHVETKGDPRGIPHLDEELRMEAAEEQRLWLRQDTWSLDDLKRSLRLVTDEVWFQEGSRMIDFRVFGPSRSSTFARVFSDVPGAICGCLEDHDGVALTPLTFRMYTSGDIFEAFGAEAVVRHRDAGGGLEAEAEVGEFKANDTAAGMRRQVASVVEIQATWRSGHTHVLGWMETEEA